jgi:hypothetical protein
MNYKRTLKELENLASLWWPISLRKEAEKTSFISLLENSQDTFFSIFKETDFKRNPEGIFDVMKRKHFPVNLFLKHLLVISDFGGEPMQRFHNFFNKFFPDRKLKYNIDGKSFEYKFQKLPVMKRNSDEMTKLNNKLMSVEIDMIKDHPIYEVKPILKDVLMLLLYGYVSEEPKVSYIFAGCNVVQYFLENRLDDFELFLKRRYIAVSTIIRGSLANDLGYAAQNYVVGYLSAKLGKEYLVRSNGKMPGVTENNGTSDVTFDILVNKIGMDKYFGIELSFQVTTNSTVERKGKLAANLLDLVHEKGNFAGYIIDGAGNFQRNTANEDLCSASDCNVAYSDSEFDILVKFILEKLG